ARSRHVAEGEALGSARSDGGARGSAAPPPAALAILDTSVVRSPAARAVVARAQQARAREHALSEALLDQVAGALAGRGRRGEQRHLGRSPQAGGVDPEQADLAPAVDALE